MCHRTIGKKMSVKLRNVSLEAVHGMQGSATMRILQASKPISASNSSQSSQQLVQLHPQRFCMRPQIVMWLSCVIPPET